MTQEFLQDAIVEDLKQLFSHYTLTNSLGVERAVTNRSAGPPHSVRATTKKPTRKRRRNPMWPVKLSERRGDGAGRTADRKRGHWSFACATRTLNRQGYRDALHIVNEIVRHYERDGIVANRYEAQHPIRWAAQEEADTHPYYFAAVGLPFHAPAIFKEVPET